MQTRKYSSRMIHVLYAISFFFSIHLATTAYVNSSFIEGFAGAKAVGLIYAVASLIGFTALFCLPALLRKYGSKISGIWAVVIHMFSLWMMIKGGSPAFVVGGFLLYLISNTIIIFFLDIFLENLTPRKRTGTTRGLYLTITNLAWVASPILAGKILESLGYASLYTWAFMAMIPVFLLTMVFLGNYTDAHYRTFSFINILRKFVKDRDVARIWMINFILQFFYAWMVIYTPIYLSQHIGLSWGEIGLAFTIMLLPFVLLEYPLGVLSDKVGEKNMLVGGFVVATVATYIMSFTFTSSVLLWGALLFATRVGASTIEVMADTYFFKKVTAEDTDLIGFYRNAYPVAYIVGPMLASLLLIFLPFRFLFIILAFILFIGIGCASRLKDIR